MVVSLRSTLGMQRRARHGAVPGDDQTTRNPTDAQCFQAATALLGPGAHQCRLSQKRHSYRSLRFFDRRKTWMAGTRPSAGPAM